MLVIGLTGGIASGKSSVSRKLKEIGMLHIDADEISREIVKYPKPAWRDLVDYFGSNILLPSKEINRKLLGSIVFNNERDREYLMKVTHPRILEECQNQIDYYQKMDNDKLIILDAALLIESGAIKMVDKVWLVYCDDEVQVKRLMKRDGISEFEARRIISTQMPLSEKVLYSHEIIDNNGSLEKTYEQVLSLVKDYVPVNME